MKHYLLIVEGEKSEPKLFESVFSRYGFSVVRHPRPVTLTDFFLEDMPMVEFQVTEVGDGKDIIHVMQAPNNCIEGFLHQAARENWDLSKAFHQDTDFFSGKFIVFDVDHAPDKELSEMMERFFDETDQGLLIISSPCLEVISDPRRKDPIIVKTPSDYKKSRNKALQADPQVKMGALDYIIKNFEELMTFFLDSNTELFHSKDVMEHPHLAVEEVIRCNFREKDEGLCYYNYYSTVIYVIVGYIKGFTKEFENVAPLREFFLCLQEGRRISY